MEEIIKKIENFNFKALDAKRKTDLAFLLVAVLLGIYFDWGMPEIIIFAIFIGIIIHPISSRYLAWPALFFLSVTPFLLMLDRENRAEEFAIYAYYFLAMAVIRGIIETRQAQESEKSKIG